MREFKVAFRRLMQEPSFAAAAISTAAAWSAHRSVDRVPGQQYRSTPNERLHIVVGLFEASSDLRRLTDHRPNESAR